jgi:predicted N-acyltransferase
MSLNFELVRGVSSLDAAQWDALSDPSFPFTDHAHFAALERTGCVGEEPGWLPFVVLAREVGTQARLLGAAAFYLKDNSYGEFVFDHPWANAYARHGLPYYPKLVVSIPFTPATGQKILVADEGVCAEAGVDPDAIRAGIRSQILAVARATRCSGAHALFVEPNDVERWREAGWLVRHGFQYHWRNRGYANFDGFLAALDKKRRRQIALERRQLRAEQGLTLETVEGEALSDEHALIASSFYADTNLRYGSLVCLTREFFLETFRTMRDRIVLFLARREGEPIAMALNYRKGKNLYGRYWGCSEEVRNLHFEMCYYRAVEYAIDRGYALCEAGAQGEHKLPRGFEPTLTYSAHTVFHPAFSEAIAHALEEEKQGIERLFREFAEHSPYKDAPGTSIT